MRVGAENDPGGYFSTQMRPDRRKLLKRLSANRTALQVYVTLETWADWRPEHLGVVEFTLDALRRETGLSNRTLARHLDWLRDEAFVVCLQRGNSAGPSVYQLPDFPPQQRPSTPSLASTNGTRCHPETPSEPNGDSLSAKTDTYESANPSSIIELPHPKNLKNEKNKEKQHLRCPECDRMGTSPCTRVLAALHRCAGWNPELKDSRRVVSALVHHVDGNSDRLVELISTYREFREMNGSKPLTNPIPAFLGWYLGFRRRQISREPILGAKPPGWVDPETKLEADMREHIPERRWPQKLRATPTHAASHSS